MAEIETLTIYKAGVDTHDAVQNINDLKNNIRELTKIVNAATVGEEEYKNAVKKLTANQNALKAVTYGTSQSFEEVQKSVLTTTKSYNTLVKQLASYKAEMRNVDISTEEGKKEFADLAKKINGVNDELKKLDADQGVYVRNVGNYSSHWQKFHDIVGNLPPSMNITKQAMDQLDKSARIMTANPILGIITLVAPLINKIADGLKDNEKATAALNKAMKALEPVMQFFEGLLDKIADALTWVVDQLVELAGKSDGMFKKVVSGATGVGNAILNFIVTPFRIAIEAGKGLVSVLKNIFSGNWKAAGQSARDAIGAISGAIDKGFSFKQNFNAGQAAADAFVDGLSTRRKKAKDAGKAIAQDVKDGFEEVVVDMAADMDAAIAKLDKSEAAMLKNALAREQERLEAIDATAKHRQAVNAATVDDEKKRAEESYRIQQEANEKKLAALEEFQQAAIERGDLDAYLKYEQRVADMEVEIEEAALEERARIRRKDVEDAEKAAQAKAKLMQEYAAGVGNVLGAIADLYDVNADKDKRSFENSKRFQIAETWVNTLSGMASAIWATWNDKTIPSAIAKAALAATNAAGILASGIATAAKIRATSFGSGGGSGAGIVAAAAPAVDTALPQVLQAQTASDIDRLNRASEPSRVYILQSDIQAAGQAQRVRVAESTF